MRCEFNALLGDFTKLSQGKYLKSATIGKHGLIPIKELVNSTKVVN